MDQFISPPGATEPSWIENRVEELRGTLAPYVGGTSWNNEVDRIITEYLDVRRQHLYVNHSLHNPGYPDNAGIPDAQIGNPSIEIAYVEHNPASGIRDEEYLVLYNPNNTAVDISYWRIEGDISHTFTPGTVIPAGGSLYLSPDVPTFLARTTGPRGNQGLFVQGNYSGNLANEGGVIHLLAADNSPIDQYSTILPGDYNYDQVVDQQDYLVWKASYGSTSELAADGNGDGVVDLADYTIWRNNLGATSLPPAAVELAIEESIAEGTAPIGEEEVDAALESHLTPLTPELAPAGEGWSPEILSLSTRQSQRGERPATRQEIEPHLWATAPPEHHVTRPELERSSAPRRAPFSPDLAPTLVAESSDDAMEGLLLALDLAFEHGLDR